MEGLINSIEFEDLPVETKLEIFSKMDDKTLLNLSRTNKKYYGLINHEIIRKRLALRLKIKNNNDIEYISIYSKLVKPRYIFMVAKEGIGIVFKSQPYASIYSLLDSAFTYYMNRYLNSDDYKSDELSKLLYNLSDEDGQVVKDVISDLDRKLFDKVLQSMKDEKLSLKEISEAFIKRDAQESFDLIYQLFTETFQYNQYYYVISEGKPFENYYLLDISKFNYI